MGKLTPQALLELIDREKLDSLDKIVYDGTIRLAQLQEMHEFSFGTTGNYQLRTMGKFFGNRYFAFMGQQDVVIADYLEALGTDLLVDAQDKDWLTILEEARTKGFHTSVPTDWVGARQMNHGLYDALAQFEIKPPCLRVGIYSEPDKFLHDVETLAEIMGKLDRLHKKRRQG